MTDLFDELVILRQHAQLLSNSVQNVITFLNKKDIIKELSKTSDGQKIIKVINAYKDAIYNNPSSIRLSPEQLTMLDRMLKEQINALIDLDWIIYVLNEITAALRKVTDKKIMLEITWGSQITIICCELFSYFVSVFLSFSQYSNQIAELFYYSRLSSQFGLIKGQLRGIDKVREFIDSLRKGPFYYPKTALSFFQDQMGHLLRKLSPNCLSFFLTYSTFDWSQYSIECDDFIGRKTENSSPQNFIFKYTSVYVTTMRLFALTFDDYIGKHPEHMNLLSLFLSESSRFNLLIENQTIDMKTIMKMCSTNKFIVTQGANIIADTETKMKTSHLKRIRHLDNLLSDFQEHYDVCPSTIWLYNDELLALIGLAYYQMSTCFFIEDCQKPLADLLITVLNFFDIFEKESKQMQRNYIFNLARQDFEYLEYLLGIICSREISQKMSVFCDFVNKTCQSLQAIDLESYDKGARYNFIPLYVTHGRFIIHTQENGLVNTLTTPILLHLATISNHCQLASSPIQTLYDTCPISKISDLQGAMNNVISKSTTTIICTKGYLDSFRYVQANKKSEMLFKNCSDTFISKLISSLGSMVDSSSTSAQIIRQNQYDTRFKKDAFIPYYTPENKDTYKTQGGIVNKSTFLLKSAKTMRSKSYHGSCSVNVLEEFTKKIASMVIEKLKNNAPHPLLYLSLLNVMLQNLQSVFNTIDIQLVPFIIKSIREQFFDFGVSTLKQKAEILSGTAPIKLDGYVDFYRTYIGRFVEENHTKSIYEPFGLRFVGDQSAMHPFDLMLAQTQISDFLQAFGYDGGLATIHELNKHMFSGIMQLYKTFTKCKSEIAAWMSKFLSNHDFPKEILERSDIKEASRTLMSIGVATVLYNMVKNAARAMTSALLPGFVDTTQAAMFRLYPNITPNDAIVAEAIGVTTMNIFLNEQVKKSLNSGVDVIPFFFFLALLFANTDWDFVSFHEDNDSFTNNIQLLPIAINTILESKNTIFNNPKQEDLESAESIFFTTLSTIAEIKKERDTESYESFVILIDHFPYFVTGLEYGILEHAFPFTIIRSAYNKINKEPKIFKYISSGDFDALQALLTSNPSAVDTKNSYNNTPLIAAIREGNLKIFKLILDKGADINAKNDAGDSALHFAVRSGNKEFTALLIKKGADVNMKGSHNEKPIQKAKTDGVKQILKEHGAKE